MKPKKVFFVCFSIFVSFFILAICYVFAFQKKAHTEAQKMENTHYVHQYELPKLIPAAWYVGK